MRDCGLPLIADSRRAVCARRHSFDRARSGYWNLLQPQDRRSKHPGDTPAAVVARRRLHDLGVTAPLFHAIREIAAVNGDDSVLDAGCGDGFYLGSLAAATGCAAVGVDISIPAIDAAAKRYRGVDWIVANADRAIPCADATFSLVMSITARMNASEFRRVLQQDGRLLVAIPAPDDFLELRGQGRDRVDRTVATFAGSFTFRSQHRVTTHADLDATAIDDIRHAIYRPLNAEPAQAMRVTLSLDLLLFHA